MTIKTIVWLTCKYVFRAINNLITGQQNSHIKTKMFFLITNIHRKQLINYKHKDIRGLTTNRPTSVIECPTLIDCETHKH